MTTDKIRQEAKKAHAAILDAIVRKDPETAQRRMEKHLGAYIDVASTIKIRG